MKKLILLFFITITSLAYGQRYSSQSRYSSAPQYRGSAPNLTSQSRSYRPNVQSQYNPYQAEAAYYQSFNQQMTPVYNATRQVQRVANGAVNFGSRFAGENGTILRQGYNATQRYIGSRNINLPRRYSPR
ncbi:MAG: hypothetical protein JWP94_892 [Mucilaginibacter sp.]|nr:hypothetical protein [Mucilaginibacter sp.]